MIFCCFEWELKEPVSRAAWATFTPPLPPLPPCSHHVASRDTEICEMNNRLWEDERQRHCVYISRRVEEQNEGPQPGDIRDFKL
ncbi:hypothetical protein EYF80_023512 [Liparis tanakae]|uniref:Uncharacterized protein n=1 Tax=Liparis tanakae TaxID=230148 RepID=A0A4Z2HKD7_9TELE|nr:hypothetical protein EYF80_023512 [Liparis tanakae]